MAESDKGESPEVTTLSQVFDGASPAEPTKPASEASEGEKDPVAEETSSPASSEDEKKTEEESSKEETKSPEKSDDTKDTESKDDAEKKKEEPSPEKNQVDWESDDNPFVKRWKDTHSNWNKTHQDNLQLQSQNAELARQLGILQKKVDGTYDPDVDEPQVKPEDIATKALNVGKTLASRNAAIAQLGQEKVSELLNEFNSTFGQNEVVQSIVLNSDSPVQEAFNILERFKFEQKYGTKPDAILKSVKEELRKELEPELRKSITDEILGRVDKKKKTPTGLSSSRGSNGLEKGNDSSGQTPLNEIF